MKKRNFVTAIHHVQVLFFSQSRKEHNKPDSLFFVVGRRAHVFSSTGPRTPKTTLHRWWRCYSPSLPAPLKSWIADESILISPPLENFFLVFPSYSNSDQRLWRFQERDGSVQQGEETRKKNNVRFYKQDYLRMQAAYFSKVGCWPKSKSSIQFSISAVVLMHR